MTFRSSQCLHIEDRKLNFLWKKEVKGVDALMKWE